MYLGVKYAHLTFALLSISFFIIRSIWSVFDSPMLQQKWVRITPHINDTLLLSCALYLMLQSHQYPFQQPWLTAKFTGLIIYILLGTIAIKRGKTALLRGLFAIMAVVVFSYILAVAFYRLPLPF